MTTTPANGAIDVAVCLRGKEVDISVTDSGIGISEQDQPIIFQRFNRAIHDHGELVPGIGLALVKELVEANKGHIELSSELGKGSTFVVTLPIFVSIANAGGLVSIEVSEQQLDLEIDSVIGPETVVTAITNNDELLKTILIIDDLRTLLQNQLAEHYHCIVPINDQQGLELANEHLPYFVLSDVMMPVMDGYQLAQALKSADLTSHIPIILLTAKGSVQSRIKGLQLLIFDYPSKPFNIEELLLRISNILTIRDILKSRFAQAIELLDTGQRASSVYHAVGFSSHSYFSQCFKAKFGHSPKAYQQIKQL